ncbi:uncharacterized protein V1516DRAFT_682221 [Lipomyces oligophaga]|uniref:uncharacterized protein n=1 Tax=Lipomyces oligophaga TaxID=45792 RepID=UPI0034CFBB43
MLSKRQQAKNEAQLHELAELLENRRCADCGDPSTGWASWNIGVFLCMRCAGIHRKMGTHISKIKSVTMDTWSSDQIRIIRQTGNRRSNAVWDPENMRSRILGSYDGDEDSIVERYIRDKYELGKFRRDRDDYISKREAKLAYDEPEEEEELSSNYPAPAASSSRTGWFRRNRKNSTTNDSDPYLGEDRLRRGDRRDRKEDIYHLPNKGKRGKKTFEYDDDYDYDDKVYKLHDMGFTDRRQCINALKESKGDLLRAIEILTGTTDEARPKLPPRPSGDIQQVASTSATSPLKDAAQPQLQTAQQSQPVYDQYGNIVGMAPAVPLPVQQQQQLLGQQQLSYTNPSMGSTSQNPFGQQMTSQYGQYSTSSFQPQQQQVNPWQQGLPNNPSNVFSSGSQNNQLLSQVTGYAGQFGAVQGVNGLRSSTISNTGVSNSSGFQSQSTGAPNTSSVTTATSNGGNTGTSSLTILDSTPPAASENKFAFPAYNPGISNGPNAVQAQIGSNTLTNAFQNLSMQSQQTHPTSTGFQPESAGFIRAQPTGYVSQQQSQTQALTQTGSQYPFAQPQVMGQATIQQPQPNPYPSLSNSYQSQSLTSGLPNVQQPQQPIQSQQSFQPFQQFQPQSFIQGQGPQQQQMQFQSQIQQSQSQQPAPVQQPMRTGIDKQTLLSLYQFPDHFSSPVALPQQQTGQPDQGQSLLGKQAIGSQSVTQPVEQSVPSLKPGSHNPFLAQHSTLPQQQQQYQSNSRPVGDKTVRFDEANGGRVSPDAFGQLSVTFTGNGGARRW